MSVTGTSSNQAVVHGRSVGGDRGPHDLGGKRKHDRHGDHRGPIVHDDHSPLAAAAGGPFRPPFRLFSSCSSCLESV